MALSQKGINMVIEQITNSKLISLSDLKPGQIFIYSDEIYMTIYPNHGFNTVNLQTNHAARLDRHTFVRELPNAKLVI